MQEFLRSRLAPFAHKSFRQLFAVQSISLVGIWAFDLARSWIVVDGLGRAGELGLVLMASAIPGLFLSLYGGVLVDRLDIRRMMIMTKSLFAVLSLILAFIVEFHEIQIWHLVAFGLVQGAVGAIDGPTFQALIVRVVPREDFQQALAINSSIFHASRALGPIVAAVLMALHGPSLVFLFDGISTVGLILVLGKLKLRRVREERAETTNPWNDFFEGVKYLFNHSQLRYMILQLFTTLCLLFPVLIVVLRTYIKEKFQVSEEEFGMIFSFPAAGAMLGSLVFTITKPRMPLKALYIGVPFSVVSLLAIQEMPTALTSAIVMAFGGFFIYFCFASLTLSMALTVQEEFRGRMASLFTLGFQSIGPLMAYPIGEISDAMGYEPAMKVLALVFAAFSLFLYLLHAKHLRIKS